MTTKTPPLMLEVHVCAAGRSYKATFTSDRVAAEFIKARSNTHDFFPRDENDPGVFDHYPMTEAALYPTCEHGLALRLCAGPGHYM